MDNSTSTETFYFLSERKDLISLTVVTEKFNYSNLNNKPQWKVVQKAFPIYKNTAAVDKLLLKFNVTWSVSLMHWRVVLWLARKSNLLAFSKFLSSIWFWNIFWITFSNNFPVVDKRLIRHEFLGNLGSLPGMSKVMIFDTFQGDGMCDRRIQYLNKCAKCTRGLLGGCLRLSFGMLSIPQASLTFSDFINFSTSHGLILIGGLSSTVSSRAWTIPSTHRSWSSSHTSWGVNWFSKQSTKEFILSIGWNLRPQWPRIAVGAFGPPLFKRDFAICQIAWSVTSQLRTLVSHRSSVFLWVIILMVLEIQSPAGLHARSRVSCHKFLSLLFSFSKRAKPGRSLFRKITGSWSKSRIWDTVISDSQTFWWTRISNRSPFHPGVEWLGNCGIEISNSFPSNSSSSFSPEGFEIALLQNGFLAFRSRAKMDLLLSPGAQWCLHHSKLVL